MRVAVIDIGSNAIRAAIYDSNKLGAAEIFNEKFKNDINLLLNKEKQEINHITYKIFNYFYNIFKKLDVTKVECVATEILRNREEAAIFIQEVEKKFGFKIRALTGDEEAKITAEGLISSIQDARGVAVDLGGGSLEIAEVFDKKVHRVVSLPLGTKVLTKLRIDNPEYLTKEIEKAFEISNCQNLYLIGGSLRLLGRCFMDYNKSVVKTLHNLVITPYEFTKFLDKLQGIKNFQNFFKQYKINKSAIIAMNALITYFNPESLIVSTFGLKEGIRFGILSEEEKEKDIVLERCYDLSNILLTNLSIKSYTELFSSIDLRLNEEDIKLFKIALILSQYPRHIDRNYKAEWIINFILATDIPFNQIQRATLIVAISETHGPLPVHVPKSIWKILSKKEINLGKIIGQLIKLAITVDGPYLTSPSFSISINNNFFELIVHERLPKNIFDKACEILKKIAYLTKLCS